MSTTRIFRVTVRGRFADLDEAARARLVAGLAEHDVIRGGFSEAGPLSYDRSLDFFAFRYQVRERADDAEPAAEVLARALERTEALAIARLDADGLGHRDLKVHGTDLADIWR